MGNSYLVNQMSMDVNNKKIQSPLERFQGLDCLKLDSRTVVGTVNQTSKLVDNCSKYQLIDNGSQYGCLKCVFGYHGVVQKISDQNLHFIESCVLNVDCDKIIYYNGISEQFGKFSSCHQCLNKQLIPFIALSTPDLVQFEQIKVYSL